MNTPITANDLKTRGISYLDELAKGQDETLLTVRGKEKYVILSIEKYNKLRELELEAAVTEVREDLKTGRIKDDTIQDHISRIIHV